MSGIMVSPDFEHFKKSLWREFRDWCPWHMVLPQYRYMGLAGWQPSEQFILPFTTGAELLCGGIKEQIVGAWEGPNVHFFHFDEAQGHKTAAAFKVLAGRARLAGPQGEPPQGWLTSIPRKNWMYEYFGPIEREDDPLATFKQPGRSLVVTLKTSDNAANLAADHEDERRSVLTESEARRRMDAEWEDETDAESFLPHMGLWDSCARTLPRLSQREALVVSLDAAKGRANAPSDCFAMAVVGKLRHLPDLVCVRYAKAWQARAGEPIDFNTIEAFVVDFCRTYGPLCVTYDPYQLAQMAGSLQRQGIYTIEFNQQSRRLKADKQLYDLIVHKGIAHDPAMSGADVLRQHIQNADQKPDEDKLRIVKRSEPLKIDLTVASSMAVDVLLSDFVL